MNYYALICMLAAYMFVNTLEVATNMPVHLKDHIDFGWDGQHFIKQKNKTDLISIPFSRVTRLFSRSSKHHLQITNGTVNGLGIEESEFAKIKVSSVTFGRVRILGTKSNRYLCMNKYGRLVGRKKRSALKRNKKCIFQERETATGYRVYESVKYPNWFIAINNKGRAVPGPRSSKKKARRHRQFLPRDFSTTTRKKNYRGRAYGASRRQKTKKLKTLSRRQMVKKLKRLSRRQRVKNEKFKRKHRAKLRKRKP